MKRKSMLIFTSCLLLPLVSGCGKKVEHEISEYIIDYDIGSKENFKILQLTDIHMADKDDRERQYKFIRKTIESANADMIVVSGDSFTFASKKTAKELFDFLDSFETPWTITFGNHDEQCYFSIDWMTTYLNNYGSNCLFKDIHGDNVFGYANFAINLKKGNDLFNQIIIMDSNRYNYGEYIGYDYIKEDQIEWYRRLVTYTKSQYGEYDSQLFFHIPLPEYNDAYSAYENGQADLIIGSKVEKSCNPEYNSCLYKVIKELDSTRSINVGHDHLNDFVIKYEDIYFAYGVDSSDRIYFVDNKLGGRVITINNDKSLSFENITHEYED